MCAVTLCHLALIVTTTSTPADAQGRPCEIVALETDQYTTAQDSDVSETDAEEVGALRQKAALFAPEVHLLLWYRTQADTRTQARSPALAVAPSPHQFNATQQSPFGWQVLLRWNLVDIAEAFLPIVDAQEDIPTSPDCWIAEAEDPIVAPASRMLLQENLNSEEAAE